MKKIIKAKEGSKELPPDIGDERVVSKRVMDAKEQAQHIIDAAKKKIIDLQDQAEKRLEEVDSIREKAYAEGKAKGREDGYAAVTEKLLKLKLMQEKFYKESEPEIIKLVVAIAEKVIGKMVADHSEAIINVVKQALEHSIGDRIVVRVNPADYQNLISQDLKFRDELDRAKRLSFKEDENVSKGGCIVETEVGTIDAQLETQIGAIKKAMEI